MGCLTPGKLKKVWILLIPPTVLLHELERQEDVEAVARLEADLIAGREPEPSLGEQAKQRSMHNNYLTLPVVFLMISTHYPLLFGTKFNWLIVAMYAWAVWHDRTTSWACDRGHYTGLFRPRRRLDRAMVAAAWGRIGSSRTTRAAGSRLAGSVSPESP